MEPSIKSSFRSFATEETSYSFDLLQARDQRIQNRTISLSLIKTVRRSLLKAGTKRIIKECNFSNPSVQDSRYH